LSHTKQKQKNILLVASLKMSYMYDFGKNNKATASRVTLAPTKGTSASVDVQHEIDAYDSYKERDALETQSDLYAIILATEHLERAYARDAISHQEYTSECLKLIGQFKMEEQTALKAGGCNSTEEFMQRFQMDCPRATQRLLKMGIPQPVNSGGGSADSNTITVTVAETVQFFITAMDAVKLEQRAVDELQPLLADLMDALTRLPETPNDFDANTRVLQWLQKLNEMRAVDEIDENDARQLSHDLDVAYAEFTRYLRRKLK
jgi:ESCRT-I complex subunit VPS28